MWNFTPSRGYELPSSLGNYERTEIDKNGTIKVIFTIEGKVRGEIPIHAVDLLRSCFYTKIKDIILFDQECICDCLFMVNDRIECNKHLDEVLRFDLK